MPQKYQIELPSGEKFEIEEPDQKTNHALALGTGVVKGAGDVTGVTPIVNAVSATKEMAPDLGANIRSGAQSPVRTLIEMHKGMIDSPMAQQIKHAAFPPSMVTDALTGKLKVPTKEDLQAQVDPAMGTADPWEKWGRRATNVLGMAALGLHAKSGGKPGGGAPPPPSGPRALLPAVTDTALETSARVNTQEMADRAAGLMSAAKNPPKPIPGSRLVPGGQPANRPGVVPQILEELKKAGASTPEPTTQLAPPPFSNGEPAAPTQPRVNVLRGTKRSTPKATGPEPESNVAMRAENEVEAGLAGRTEAPGTEPSYQGHERRAQERAPNPELDRLMNETRARMAQQLPTNPEATISKPPGPEIAPPANPLSDQAILDNIGQGRKKGEVIRVGYDAPGSPATPPSAKGEPYTKSVTHVTTPEGAEGIRTGGYDLNKRGGIGGDHYGPGIYVADTSGDLASFWRSQLETKNETGTVAATTLRGNANLKNALVVVDMKSPEGPLGKGIKIPLDRRDIIAKHIPQALAEFDQHVQSGMSKNRALGEMARKAGYDGIVFERRAGDEVIAFDPQGVAWEGDGRPGNVLKGAQTAPLKSHADILTEMGEMRDRKPRPLNKMFGSNGPTPEQLAKWEADNRAWNNDYAKLSKQQKIALERENAAFAASKGKQPSPEVQARLDAGEPPEAIATDLRDKLGSKRAAAQMGRTPEEVKALSGGGPSRIPANAAEKIKAALSDKIEKGTANSQEQALWDRIKGERGAVNLKKLLVLGGAAAGGVVGASLNDNGDPTSDQALGKVALGILGGAALPAIALNPSKALRIGLGARTEGFLSGAAIPKNIATAVGATVSAAAEGGGSKGRLAPIKELLRLPTNTKEFLGALKNPASSNKYGRTAGPLSKTIGAIDHTATKLLERGGVKPDDIQRHLLTKDRSLFGGFKLGPDAAGAVDIAYPFQRVPANVFAETMEAAGRTSGVKRGPNGIEFNPRAKGAFANPDMKTALDIASVGGGAAIGEWAKGDKKKLYLGTIALALLGSRSGLGTLGMMSQVGRQAVGGVSPIPEQNADLMSFVGWPPTGWKAFKKLTGGS